jgi:hypothetical protein
VAAHKITSVAELLALAEHYPQVAVWRVQLHIEIPGSWAGGIVDNRPLVYVAPDGSLLAVLSQEFVQRMASRLYAGDESWTARLHFAPTGCVPCADWETLKTTLQVAEIFELTGRIQVYDVVRALYMPAEAVVNPDGYTTEDGTHVGYIRVTLPSEAFHMLRRFFGRM